MSISVCGNHIEKAETKESKLDISVLAAALFMQRIKRHKLKVYMITLYEINNVYGLKDLQEEPHEEVILKEYDEFRSLFSKVITRTVANSSPI